MPFQPEWFQFWQELSDREMFYSHRKMSKKLWVQRSSALRQDLREAWEMISVWERKPRHSSYGFQATWDSLPIAVWLKISHFPQICSIPSFWLWLISFNDNNCRNDCRISLPHVSLIVGYISWNDTLLDILHFCRCFYPRWLSFNS